MSVSKNMDIEEAHRNALSVIAYGIVMPCRDMRESVLLTS